MSKRTTQNGVARPPLCNQEPCYIESSHSRSQETKNDNISASSKRSSVGEVPTSKRKAWEAEVFKSREVLLKLLQPPTSRILSAGLALPPHHVKSGIANYPPDVCELHCPQCLGYRPISVLNRPTNRDLDFRALNDSCDTVHLNGEQRLICKKEPRLQTVASPCFEEGHSRTAKSAVFFPQQLCYRSGSSPQFCLESFSFRSTPCQQVVSEVQQNSGGRNCFRKDSLPNESEFSRPCKAETQSAGTKEVNVSKESTWGHPSHPAWVNPTGRCNLGYRSSICQGSKSDQDIVRENRSVPSETSGEVDHRQQMQPDNDAVSQLNERSPVSSSSLKETCRPFLQSHDREASCSADESLQGKPREESNASSYRVAKGNDVPPRWPNDGAKRVEKSTEEFTPVIVHCYSLSDHGLSSDQKLKDGRKQTSGKEIAPWASRQHASRDVERTSPHGDDFRDENVRVSSSARLKGREAHACSHHCDTQPENSPKVTDDEVEDPEHVKNRSTSIIQPPHALAKVIASVNQRSLLLTPQVHLNGWETYLTQDRKSYLTSRRPLEYASQPQKDECIQSSFGQRGLRDWSNKHKCHGTGSLEEMFDVNEGKRILVEKVYRDIPLSVQEKERGFQRNTQTAERRGGYHDDHGRKPKVQPPQIAGTACFDGPLRIQVFQQDTAVGSKKRKSRQPRPQRTKSEDASHFQGETDDDMPGVPFGKEHSENAYEQREQLQLRSPFSDGCHEGEEDEEEPERVTAMDTHEDDQDPSHCNDKNSCDNRTVESTSSSASRIFRREIPFDTLSPRCNTSRRRRIIEQSTSLFPEDKRQEVPWSAAISRNQRHENDVSRECETMSSWKSDTTTKIAAKSWSKVLNDSDNKSPQLDRGQHLWRIPVRMSGRGSHNFEILEERRTSLANGRENLTADLRMQYSHQSRHDMSVESGKRFAKEARLKSYDSGRHDGVIEKGGHSTKNPCQPSEPLPFNPRLSNSGGVPMVSAHEDELMLSGKSGQPLQTDLGDFQSESNQNLRIEEQTRSFPGTQTNLLLHSRGAYATDVVPSVKERRFVCRFCCKKFAHFSTLQNHVRTHTGDKPFQCKYCSRRFAQSGVLKAHLRTHTGDKPFVCVYCRKTFAQSTTLTNHLRTHTGQKPYVCNFCGKSFSQPSTLRKHELSHTKERPYPCKFCGKAFAQQSTLTNHLRSHTGQRPYKCQFCEKSFAQLSTLDRHLRLHSTVSLKPHRCQYCAKSFSYFSNLASHMQVHQKEQHATED